MSDTKNNVTINKEYDGNLKKFDTMPSWVYVMGSSTGFGLIFLLITMIFTPLALLVATYGKEWLVSLGDIYNKIVALIPPVLFTIFTVICLRETLKDAMLALKTIKYVKVIPKSNVEFEKLGIPSFFEYVQYLQTNLFVYKRKDNTVSIISPYISEKDIKETLRAAIIYYNDKKCLYPVLERTDSPLEELFYKSNDFLHICPQFSQLRPAYVLHKLFLEAAISKVYVDRNSNIHVIREITSSDGIINYDFDISNFYGDTYYGYQCKQTLYSRALTDDSIFNEISCKVNKSSKDNEIVAFGFSIFMTMMTFITWFDFFGLLK